MITPQLLAELKKKEVFKILLSKFGKDYTFVNAPDHFYDNLRDEITAALSDRNDLNDLIRSEIISSRTLKKVFSPDAPIKNPHDGRRLKSLNAILEWLEIPKGRWSYYLSVDPNFQVINQELLEGNWWIYRYYGDQFYRTRLRLHIIGTELKAVYRSLHNSTFDNGNVHIENKGITISFSGGKTIEITAFIADSVLNGGKVLNAIIRSVRENYPYAVQCLVIFHKKERVYSNINDDLAEPICHTSEQAANPDAFSDPAIDPIVEYLSIRNHEIEAKALPNPSLKGLALEVEAEYKTSDLFSQMKLSLSKEWFSLSYISGDNLGIATWSFTFDDKTKKCTVDCSLGARSFSGEVHFARGKIIIDVVNKEQFPLKRVVLNADAASLELGKMAGSSIFADDENTGRTLMYRELFVKCGTGIEKPGHPLKLEKFFALNGLTLGDKEFILKDSPVINKPDILSGMGGTAELLKPYAGDYLAFILNAYQHDSLFQIKLQISVFGGVKETISFNTAKSGASQMPVEYTGRASLWHEVLRLNNENSNGEESHYIFYSRQLYHGGPFYLQGITGDTDSNRKPCSDACVAFPVDFFGKDYDTDPGVIIWGSDRFNKLEELFLQHIRISPKDYFFGMYPSIRFKRKPN